MKIGRRLFLAKFAGLAAGVATMLGAGCATMQESSTVTVGIVDVHFIQATVLETTADITVRVQNESPEPLKLTGAVHKFYFNNRNAGQGMTGDTIEIPRFGTATYTVRVYLRNWRLAEQIHQTANTGKLDYKVQSTLHRGHGLGGKSYRQTDDGSLDFSKLRFAPEVQPFVAPGLVMPAK